jgi:DNA-binding transcriptional MerR regulator
MSTADEKLDKALDLLGRHGASLAQIDTRLEHYNAQLEYHIKRSNMLEERLGPVESHIKSVNRLTKAGWALLLAAATAWFTDFFSRPR